jgi:hypothetical protein
VGLGDVDCPGPNPRTFLRSFIEDTLHPTFGISHDHCGADLGRFPHFPHLAVGVGQSGCGRQVGLFPKALRVVLRFAANRSRSILGFQADLVGGVLRRPQYFGGLFSKRFEELLFAQGLRIAQPRFELRDPFPQCDLVGSHSAELVGNASQEETDVRLGDSPQRALE